MKRWSMFVTPLLPDYVQDELKKEFDVLFNSRPGRLPDNEIIAGLDGKEIFFTWIGDRVGAELIRQLPPSVRAIATYSVGYDHVDLHAAEKRGIAVFNTPGILTDAVADAAMLYVLGTARRVMESVALARGRWEGWTPLQLNGRGLSSKVMGIYGFGRIGQAIAQRARGFGMKIAYSGRSPSSSTNAIYFADPDDLVASSDVLVLACSSTPETVGFLNKKRISLMHKEAIVVNVSRGNIVDDDALISALLENRILGAGLDVFNNEPNFDPRYRELTNAFIMPHIGSSTVEARKAMGAILVDGLMAFINGRSSPNRLV